MCSLSFAMILLVGLFYSARETKGLEAYVGKDLRQLKDLARDEFQQQVDTLTGDKFEKNEWRRFEPWWLEPLTAGNLAWVYLEAYPGYDVPDVSGMQVHGFDKHWKRLVKQTFPTGYRMFLNDVTILKDNPLKQKLLVARLTSSGPFLVEGDKKRPAFEQGEYQRQYYALWDNQFVLVRLEDNGNHLVRNSYRSSIPMKGPAVPKRTRDEWIRSLGSDNPIEQLATLVWLSGAHLATNVERRPNHSQESIEDSKLFEVVRDAAETGKALRELTRSSNGWVQEYAKLSLQARGP